jgi:positive regulator of sigma E activity
LLADRLDLIECRYQGGEPQVGETVTVEIAETRLLGAAALAYGLPIIGMIVGAVIASFLIAVPSVDAELTVTLAGEAVAVGGALVGLLLGGWLAHAIAHRRRIADLLTPELVRGDRS